MRLIIKFNVRDDQTGEDAKRTISFNRINGEATNEDFINFSKAFMSLTDINKYQIVKETTEIVSNIGE